MTSDAHAVTMSRRRKWSLFAGAVPSLLGIPTTISGLVEGDSLMIAIGVVLASLGIGLTAYAFVGLGQY